MVLLDMFANDNPSWFDRPGRRPAPQLPALMRPNLAPLISA